MTREEPHGHRGHPFDREERAARKLAVYLERAIARLVKEGFSRDEAVAFIAGIAYSKAEASGETWSNPYNATQTIERVLAGRAAKDWSISALVLALYEIGDLTS